MGQPRSPPDIIFLSVGSGFLDIVVGVLYILTRGLRVVIVVDHGSWGASGSNLLDHTIQVLTESLNRNPSLWRG